MTPAIGEWLEEVVRDETPSPAIVAFNIGLFDSPEGYCAYLSGTDVAFEDDPGRASGEAFTPSHWYCVLGEPDDRDWQEVQASVVESVHAFLDSPHGAASFLGKARAVTVGFDDGDLVCVKTS
jgi:hypothetical protein